MTSKTVVTQFTVLLTCACTWSIITVRAQTTSTSVNASVTPSQMTPGINATTSAGAPSSPQTPGNNSLSQTVQATATYTAGNAGSGQTIAATTSTASLSSTHQLTAGAGAGATNTAIASTTVVASTVAQLPATSTNMTGGEATSTVIVSPSSTSSSGASSIVGTWSEWSTANCDASCCNSPWNKKYNQTRTCNTHVSYCPADANSRDLSKEVDCPTCDGAKCSGSQLSNTLFLVSTFILTIGYLLL